MSDSSNERKALPAVAATATPSTPDANDGALVYGEGLDPADFDWVPVKRKRRSDGWSQQRQQGFIETLAATGSVTLAAAEVGMSTTSAYRLRNAADGAAFANAWDVATQAASRRFIDIAMDRVVNGAEEPVFDRDGNRVGRRVRYNDRLLMFMLRALQPGRFRHANQDSLGRHEALPRSAPSVDEALAALAPPAPVDPAALIAPDELGYELQLAALNDGRLPMRHRDPVEQGVPEAPRRNDPVRGSFVQPSQPLDPDHDLDSWYEDE